MKLPGLDEPVGLRDRAASEPDTVKAEIASGGLISAPLWKAWGPTLSDQGVDRQALRAVLRGYGYELWLWAAGQHGWEQCLEGLAGRVNRRFSAGTGRRGSRRRRPPAGRTTGTAPSRRAKKATKAAPAKSRSATKAAPGKSGSSTKAAKANPAGRSARESTKAARAAKSGGVTRAAPAKSGRATKAAKPSPARRSPKTTRRR